MAQLWKQTPTPELAERTRKELRRYRRLAHFRDSSGFASRMDDEGWGSVFALLGCDIGCLIGAVVGLLFYAVGNLFYPLWRQWGKVRLWRTERRLLRLYQALTNRAEPVAIDLFLEGVELSIGSGAVVQRSYTALLQALAATRSSNARFFGEETRERLRIIIAAPLRAAITASLRKNEIRLLSLQTLGRIGNASDLRWLEEFASPPHKPRHQPLYETAEQVLVELRQRVQFESERETLLRASSAPAPDPTTLLRPAETMSATSPDQLLRASGKKADE